MKDYCLIEVKARKKVQDKNISKSNLLFENVILLECLIKCFTENKSDFRVNTENKRCFCKLWEDEHNIIQWNKKFAKLFHSIKNVLK